MNFIRTTLLWALKVVARIFYTFDIAWLNDRPPRPWSDLRVLAFLNHTSLYEWLFVGAAPNHLLKRIASHGCVPVADFTLARRYYGAFLKTLAPHMISITREPDHTWQAVLDRLESESMVIIFPEGRMKRADGLDKHGRPMTVRGGIADLLEAIPSGKMLVVYSGGLHHVQVPGQRFPKLFKTLRIRFEAIDIESYRAEMVTVAGSRSNFKQAVKDDLNRRRDQNCPAAEPPIGSDRRPS